MQVDGMSRRGSFPLLFPGDLLADGFPSSCCSSSSSPASLHSSSASSSPGSSAQLSYIEHQVSKMDTLAGVAIKYGVEVADIKRMNSLVTDLQMFALKTLKIPLPGRHPPSPMTPNAPSDQKPPQRKVSPAMSSLLGYYGLNAREDDSKGEGTEMAVYGAQISPSPEPRSLINGSPAENGGEKPVRRRQKAEDDGDGSLSGRSKAGARLDFDSTFLAAAPAENSPTANGVKKSSSASNLQDSERSPSTWLSSKWSMKPDGLPKPIAFLRSKAAMD